MKLHVPRLPAASAAARLVGLAGLVGLVGACASAPAAPRSADATAAPPPSEVPSTPSSADAPLPFIEDDYPRALAAARASGKPLFIDAWAAWCHSCLSLRRFVLDAPEIRARRDAFVWLALDSEKPQNDAVLGRLGLDVLPTLWIVDARGEEALWKFPGTLTAGELALALDRFGAPAPGDESLDGLLARAARAAASAKPEEAAQLLETASARAPAGWPRRAEALDARVAALRATGERVACAELAAREGPNLPLGTHRAAVALNGAACAHDPPQGSPLRDLLGAFEAELQRLVRAMDAPLLADDRSGLYEELVYLLEARGAKAEARDAARAWAAFLEGEADRALDPRARVVFDAHRLLAYLALGAPQRAVPMLEASERDFPGDYNPPARLAKAYYEMRAYDDALRAIQRAIPLAEGPRRLKLHLLAADIHAARKDTAGERAALDDALSFADRTPLRAGYVKLRDQLADRRARLGSSKAPSRR